MKTGKKNEVIDLKSYARYLEELKADILQAQLRAALCVTKELTLLYWRIGRALRPYNDVLETCMHSFHILEVFQCETFNICVNSLRAAKI